MSPRPSLDEIAAAAEDLKRQQQRQWIAQMADEVERIKAEDWKAPEDVEYVPEVPAPADWWLREQIAKELAKGRLADEPREPDSAGYTIYVEDSD
jgi:hypothetical protein